MPKDPSESTQVNTRLPLPMARQVWAEAARLEWTPSKYVRKAIEEKITRDAKKGGR